MHTLSFTYTAPLMARTRLQLWVRAMELAGPPPQVEEGQEPPPPPKFEIDVQQGGGDHMHKEFLVTVRSTESLEVCQEFEAWARARVRWCIQGLIQRHGPKFAAHFNVSVD